MITRRHLVASTAGALTLAFVPKSLRSAELPEPVRKAMVDSEVVYLTPLRANGAESKCHGEVWFVPVDGDVFVVTDANAWRAEAIRKGLTRARLWVGEFGPWTKAGDKFRSAPGFEATASIESAPDVQERVLEKMGQRYRMEWIVWGPRFRNGLKDGSRVMLRYRPEIA